MKNEEYIYVIKGETGEWSDWRCWEVVASESEDVANNFCNLLNDKLRQLELDRASRSSPVSYSDKMERIKQMEDLDPNCYVDYTGTSYEVSKVPILKRV